MSEYPGSWLERWNLAHVDKTSIKDAIEDVLRAVEENWIWHKMPKHPSHVYQRGYEQCLKDIGEEIEKI